MKTQNQSEVEEVTLTSNDEVSQKLDPLVEVVTDPSRCVEAMEEHQKEGGALPSSSPSTSHPRRREDQAPGDY